MPEVRNAGILQCCGTCDWWNCRWDSPDPLRREVGVCQSLPLGYDRTRPHYHGQQCDRYVVRGSGHRCGNCSHWEWYGSNVLSNRMGECLMSRRGCGEFCGMECASFKSIRDEFLSYVLGDVPDTFARGVFDA